jgi:tetratricopeptide (TPR) repeat protein
MRHFERALELHVELGDLAGQAIVHNRLGGAYERIGRYQDIAVQVDLALNLFRKLGDRDGEVLALTSRCWAMVLLGEYRDAIDLGHQLLRSLRDTDDPASRASLLDTVGYAHHLLGEHELAVAHFEKSLELTPPSVMQTWEAPRISVTLLWARGAEGAP